ncbi:CRISPR-associated protein, Cse1 family [Methylomonas albis]|uniref:Type I-E CRISPR-associated protein Cse1/CasA n=1 Tax=Methylomonas albis TaxID=1854563 RepID=A0ABR9D439_9GAMM|nr:type I-E CRISPR-associated protein Cse1/CasA [Methylomonas albis]MBD9357840.1 type I-E CRISPR-associated protein Cse1/CasA [Methylomonas albis]CAD6881166.1 CRISPR-associated protein, Cse1 family [Methylomonas albis]
MRTENRFNLIDEPWLPVVDVGLVSLRQIFSQPEYRALGGNPIQKIAVTKLLLAIVQAATTPADDEAWAELGPAGMAEKCLVYLEKWHDRFDLYGERPFLQMPGVCKAAIQSAGAVLPEVATGNTTVLTQIHIEKTLSAADNALLLIVLMGFGLGGKKTDNSVVLSAGYSGKANDKGKPATGKPGPALGFSGFLHSFLVGASLTETLWLNLLTTEQIAGLRVFTTGLGQAPWEQMPTGEACAIAAQLQNSLMGRLLPMSRFCLLAESGLHYSEGIAHPGYKEGMVDPSVSVDYSGKDAKAVWVDPEKRPWRFLTAMLSFLGVNRTVGYDCQLLRGGLQRARRHAEALGIWSGGLRVSSNAGEQFVSGADDFVESVLTLPMEILGEKWFEILQREMAELDQLAKIVYSATLNYYKTLGMEGKQQAGQASNLYWQLCERQFQKLVDGCDDPAQIKILRRRFADFVRQSYQHHCPNDTARQLEAWAKNQPNLGRYLHDATQPQEATT